MNERDESQHEQVREWVRQGTRRLQQGQAAEAVPPLEQAYEYAPDDFDAALNLSGAYLLTGRFKRAIPILEELRDQHPENAKVWTNLGAAYLGNPVLATDEQQLGAIEAFKKALELEPAAYSVAYNIGLVYRDRRDQEQARYWFRQAIKHDPDDQHARNQLRKLDERDDEEGPRA